MGGESNLIEFGIAPAPAPAPARELGGDLGADAFSLMDCDSTVLSTSYDSLSIWCPV